MTRREWLALVPAAVLPVRAAPVSPVAVAKVASYREDPTPVLRTMFDRIGGIEGLMRNKTVTVKLNLTGNPGSRIGGRPPGVTHFTHPRLVEAAVHLFGRAGAKRVRLVESAWATGGPLEEFMLHSGWNVRRIQNAAPLVEFENTNNRGSYREYARVKVPGGGEMFAAYDLNRAYVDTDVFVSMAKLKEHETCGVTLALKNCFGNTPASIYGDDAGADEPNEKPGKGRVEAIHFGKRAPAKSAPQEIHPGRYTEPGDRVSRVVAELCAARPIDLSIIDGIETVTGGEGPWIKGLRVVAPGVLIAGRNPVSTDAVSTAIMGYDPRAPKGVKPFATCENTLLLAEKLSIGSADLSRIEIAGIPLEDARFPFEAAAL
ncbi:MAG: DUF362 domain-containing protein [Bryobacterales bacterium]|nr:DUF362 domain-containing protein [Bryobacterales bacterium]